MISQSAVLLERGEKYGFKRHFLFVFTIFPKKNMGGILTGLRKTFGMKVTVHMFMEATIKDFN